MIAPTILTKVTYTKFQYLKNSWGLACFGQCSLKYILVVFKMFPDSVAGSTTTLTTTISYLDKEPGRSIFIWDMPLACGFLPETVKTVTCPLENYKLFG